MQASSSPPVDLDALARRVADRTGVATSPADLERIMAALLASSDFWEAVALAERPVQQVAETLTGLAEAELAQVGETITLTPAGTSLAWQRGLTPRKRFRCPHCAGHGLALDMFRRVPGRWEKVRTVVPQAEAGGQLSADALLSLVAFLADRGDLMGKAILLLDDPSLVGAALALSGFPQRVTVVEHDRDRTRALHEVIAQERLPLEIRASGVDAPLAPDLRGAFHTLILAQDQGAEETATQVQHGLAGLRGPGCAAVYSLSPAHVSLPAWATLAHRLLERAPLALTDLLKDTLEYERHPRLEGVPGPSSGAGQRPPTGPWYRAALVRWETLPGFDPALFERQR